MKSVYPPVLISFYCLVFAVLFVTCRPAQLDLASFKTTWSQPGYYSEQEKEAIREFLFEEYFSNIEGASYSALLKGEPIYADEADDLTSLYYDQFGDASTPQAPNQTRDEASKSVYFEAGQIYTFINSLVPSCPGGGTLGLRFYFARYPNDYIDENLRNQNTIILRGVCNYVDLAHRADERTATGLKVAWNFGDVCPPTCLENRRMICEKGEYDSAGGAYYANCRE